MTVILTVQMQVMNMDVVSITKIFLSVPICNLRLYHPLLLCTTLYQCMTLLMHMPYKTNWHYACQQLLLSLCKPDSVLSKLLTEPVSACFVVVIGYSQHW